MIDIDPSFMLNLLTLFSNIEIPTDIIHDTNTVNGGFALLNREPHLTLYLKEYSSYIKLLEKNKYFYSKSSTYFEDNTICICISLKIPTNEE